MRRKRILYIGLIAFGSLLLTAACASQPAALAAEAPQPTPTLVSVGSAIDKPVPYGYDIILEEIVLRIDEVILSDNTVLTNGAGETILEENQEFLLIRITNQCVKPGLEKCFVSQTDYRVFDPEGNSLEAELDVIGLNELYTPEEFGSGTSKKGLLVFRVNQDQSYPILSYRQFNGEEIYLSLAD